MSSSNDQVLGNFIPCFQFMVHFVMIKARLVYCSTSFWVFRNCCCLIIIPCPRNYFVNVLRLWTITMEITTKAAFRQTLRLHQKTQLPHLFQEGTMLTQRGAAMSGKKSLIYCTSLNTFSTFHQPCGITCVWVKRYIKKYHKKVIPGRETTQHIMK